MNIKSKNTHKYSNNTETNENNNNLMSYFTSSPIPNDYLKDNNNENLLYTKSSIKKCNLETVPVSLSKKSENLEKRLLELECLYENTLKDKNYEELLSSEVINGLKAKIEKYEEDLFILTNSNNSLKENLEELHKESELTLIENNELKKELEIKIQTVNFLQDTLLKLKSNEYNTNCKSIQNEINSKKSSELINVDNSNEILNMYTKTVENSIKELSDKMENLYFDKEKRIKTEHSKRSNSYRKKVDNNNKIKEKFSQIKSINNDYSSRNICTENDNYEYNCDENINSDQLHSNSDYISDLISNKNKFINNLIIENNSLKSRILNMNEIFLKKQFDEEKDFKLYKELNTIENERKNVRILYNTRLFLS